MACDLSTIQAAACESGIGKLDSKIKLLQAIAQLSCELSEAEPGNLDGLIWGPSPETVDSILGGSDAVIGFLASFTNGSAYTELSFGNPTHTTSSVEFSNSALMTSLTFRLLETVGGDLAVDGSTVLTSFSAPLLQSVTGDLNFDSSAALLNLTLPSLTSAPATILVANGVIETLSLPVMSSYPIFGINADASLLTLNLPACVDDGAGQLDIDLGTMTGLVTLNLNALTAVTADFDASIASLASLTLTSLVSVGGSFSINTSALTTLSLPALTTLAVDLNAGPVVGLASFSAPVWLPTDGTIIDFNGDALDATSVEGILRRCMVAGVTTCTISVDGGTNAGLASLSAQGQTDAADLVTAGNTLNINP